MSNRKSCPSSWVPAWCLAAGKGTRMRSALPKVLHPLAGRPLLAPRPGGRPRAAARAHHRRLWPRWAGGARVVPRTAEPASCCRNRSSEQGMRSCRRLPHLPTAGATLVLYGDVPLIRPATLQQLLDQARRAVPPHRETGRPERVWPHRARCRRWRACASSRTRMQAQMSSASHEINTGVLSAPERQVARLAGAAHRSQRTGGILPSRRRAAGVDRRHAGAHGTGGRTRARSRA